MGRGRSRYVRIILMFVSNCLRPRCLLFSIGNHETRGVYSDALIKYFPTSTGTFYYRFNIGKVCFLVLDSGEDKPDSDLEYAGIADYDNYRGRRNPMVAECGGRKRF